MIKYVAGFFDGEGCCGFFSSGKYHQPHIEIGNTHREVLIAIQKAVQLGEVQLQKQRKASWKPMFVLRFPKQHIAKFCKLIIPYTIIKKQQLELMIKYLDESTTESEREIIRDEMSILNKRGM